MSVKIGIIDYGMGNLKSVYKAFRFLRTEPVFIDKEEDFDCDGLILPGVGAFEDGMKNLAPFIKILNNEVKTKPLLGICLGMQMLFSDSEENGFFKGLDYIPGSVKKLPEDGLKVPHMGWNTICDVKGDLYKGFTKEEFVYFVHSFYVPVNEFTIATTDYIHPFSASLQKDNFYATQFHPEKSGKVGERILENFINLPL